MSLTNIMKNIFGKKEQKEKIFHWTVPDYTPQKYWGKYDTSVRKTNRLIFMLGIELPCADMGKIKTSQDPSTYDLIYNVEGSEARLKKYDVLPNNGTAPLVNKRTLSLLQELCPNDFQAFPAIIRGEGKDFESYDNHDYSIINIIVQKECIDKEKSKLTYFESGSIDSIKKLVPNDASCMEGHHLVRDKYCHSMKFCSPTLVALFKEHKIKGVDFIDEDQFNAMKLG